MIWLKRLIKSDTYIYSQSKQDLQTHSSTSKLSNVTTRNFSIFRKHGPDSSDNNYTFPVTAKKALGKNTVIFMLLPLMSIIGFKCPQTQAKKELTASRQLFSRCRPGFGTKTHLSWMFKVMRQHVTWLFKSDNLVVSVQT